MNPVLDAPIGAPPLRPTLRFMLSHPAHVIALGFGAGLSPFAPGTAGTLLAWAMWLFLAHWLTPFELGLVIVLSLLAGWWACTVTAIHMRVLDPRSIVWDEVVCFWIVLWLLLPAGFGAQVAAFAVFRFFDAVKPGPIGWADALFHRFGFGWRGGLGILLDDLVAAMCTLLVLAAWKAWW